MINNKVELLAPAGSMEALIAAVQNGANAIYLGGQNFSARASANNFSNEELVEALFYAHFRNVKIYVTVNTLLDQNEVERALDYVAYLYSIGVDGIIVQDLGLAKLIRENFPSLELHASTQMTINSLEGAKLLEESGFSRVVLARETPLAEAKLISQNTNLEIEAFAHGALCISYSGQCLMSSMIGGRSGNRGRCAQPCRKSYEIVNENKDLLKTQRAYLLSPMDLYTLENIDSMLQAGINSIKIEGRMKRPEYVATVIAAYRKAIDKKDLRGQEEKLKQAFNRGFTKGLPFSAFGRDLVEISRPDNRGLEVGTVIKGKGPNCLLEIFQDLSTGDVLEFETKKGRKTYQVSQDHKKGKINLRLPFDIEDGTTIRRIKKEKDNQAARDSYKEDHLKKKVSLHFIGKLGQEPSLAIRCQEHYIKVIGDEKVQKAQKAPMDQEKIKKQLEKLGDTSFLLEDLQIEIDENIFLPVSKINDLRRRGLEDLEKELRKKSLRDYIKPRLVKEEKAIKARKLKLAISLEEKEDLEKINLEGIDRLYLRFLDKKIYKDLLEKNIEVYYRSPKILYHQDLEKLGEKIKSVEMTGLLVDNLGSVYKFPDHKKIGDTGLNIFNSYSLDFLEKSGLEDSLLSTELTLKQIEEIRKYTDKSLQATAYGFIRVMTMNHCPFSPIKNCGANRRCQTCNFKEGYYLRDEKNVDFRVKRQDDLSTIYNAYPISMVDNIVDLEKAGLDYILLDFSFEEDKAYIVEEFKRALRGEKTSLNQVLKEKYQNITYGHYYRGVE